MAAAPENPNVRWNNGWLAETAPEQTDEPDVAHFVE